MNQSSLDRWLKGRCLRDSEGDQVVDFDLLVDGGMYTLGPAIEQVSLNYRVWVFVRPSPNKAKGWFSLGRG